MATSNSWSYSLTAAEIIQAAYEDLGLIVPGGMLSSADTTLALARLNMLVKQYQGQADGAQGLKVHTRQRITLVLAKGQNSYLIGSGANDARASTAMGRTTLVAPTPAGQTSLWLAANPDTTSYPGNPITMAPGDFLGVEVDDGTLFWTKVNGTLSTGATTLGPLPTDASSGNQVFWFASRAQRFPVLEAVVLRGEGLNDSPLEVYTHVHEYEYGVASKFAPGTPTSVLCEPLRTQTRITFDSNPTEVSQTAVLTVLYPSEDYAALTDDIAYPQEGLRFLSWELAFALSPSFGRWTKEMEMNRTEARALYMNLNPEMTTLYFTCGGE